MISTDTLYGVQRALSYHSLAVNVPQAVQVPQGQCGDWCAGVRLARRVRGL
mgnify:CR=1 FL=1